MVFDNSIIITSTISAGLYDIAIVSSLAHNRDAISKRTTKQMPYIVSIKVATDQQEKLSYGQPGRPFWPEQDSAGPSPATNDPADAAG
jgi:hypothetical protein